MQDFFHQQYLYQNWDIFGTSRNYYNTPEAWIIHKRKIRGVPNSPGTLVPWYPTDQILDFHMHHLSMVDVTYPKKPPVLYPGIGIYKLKVYIYSLIMRGIGLSFIYSGFENNPQIIHNNKSEQIHLI